MGGARLDSHGTRPTRPWRIRHVPSTCRSTERTTGCSASASTIRAARRAKARRLDLRVRASGGRLGEVERRWMQLLVVVTGHPRVLGGTVVCARPKPSGGGSLREGGRTGFQEMNRHGFVRPSDIFRGAPAAAKIIYGLPTHRRTLGPTHPTHRHPLCCLGPTRCHVRPSPRYPAHYLCVYFVVASPLSWLGSCSGLHRSLDGANDGAIG